MSACAFPKDSKPADRLRLRVALVESVQNPVHHRRCQQADHGHDDQRGEESVEARKNFHRVAGIPLRVERAGSAEQHARFEEGIHEVQPGDFHVAQNADAERGHDQAEGEEELPCQPPQKYPVRGEWLRVVLPENHPPFIAGEVITRQTKSWPLERHSLPFGK